MTLRPLATLLLGFAFLVDEAGAADPPWYRIEVIVFAYSEPSGSSETWAPMTRSYPGNLVAIRTGDPQPHTYQQLADVVNYERMFAETEDLTSPVRSRQTFLFESESRFYDESTRTLQRHQSPPASSLPATNPGRGNPSSEPDALPGGSETTYNSLEDAVALLESDSYTPWHQLPEEARQLRQTARSLRRSRRYRLLDHLLWAQPIGSQQSGDAPVILIESGKRFDDRHELAGTLTFTRSRYLHINAQLTYTAFAPTGTGIPGLLPPSITREDLEDHEEIVAWEADLGAYAPDGFAHLEVSQRVRKGEVQYLDHPWFGMLIRIDDYEVETASP